MRPLTGLFVLISTLLTLSSSAQVFSNAAGAYAYSLAETDTVSDCRRISISSTTGPAIMADMVKVMMEQSKLRPATIDELVNHSDCDIFSTGANRVIALGTLYVRNSVTYVPCIERGKKGTVTMVRFDELCDVKDEFIGIPIHSPNN